MEYHQSHRNIAKLIGFAQDPHAIVMKFYRYGSLDTWIFSSNVKKSQIQILSFMIDIARGISAMHNKGFCHADLKPQNVLIDFDETTGQLFCVLTDFGITKVFNNTSLLVGQFVPVNMDAASIAYAAPEVLRCFRHKIPQEQSNELPFSDIYSFGVVMIEILCRKKAYTRE